MARPGEAWPFVHRPAKSQQAGWRVGPSWCAVPGWEGPGGMERYVCTGVVVMCARGVVHVKVVCPGFLVVGLGLVLPGVGVAVWGFVGFWFRRGHVVDQGHHGLWGWCRTWGF